MFDLINNVKFARTIYLVENNILIQEHKCKVVQRKVMVLNRIDITSIVCTIAPIILLSMLLIISQYL